MGEQAVVVAAATYTSRAAAAENLRALCGEPPPGSLGRLAAAIVEKANNGNQTVPTLVFADGSAQTNPSLAQVKEKLAALA